MASKFGRIDYSETSFIEQTFHKNQTLTSASVGISQHFGLQDSYTDDDSGGRGDIHPEGAHWASIHTMFYSSGSSKINPDEVDKFNGICSEVTDP